jgi:glutamate formiminotransferase / 5-formyltetrahydrofolate cyclo-ligase
MPLPTLLSVPNVSEGRDAGVVAAIAQAFAARGTRPGEEEDACAGGDFAAPVRLLDVHSDPDHHRSVFTLAAQPRALADAILRGARAAVEQIDVTGRGAPRGQHPHVGALDVVPVVYLQPGARGAACAEALVVADRIGRELDVPVFLYGDLAGGRTRAELRRDGVGGLAERIKRAHSEGSQGEAVSALQPDFGPPRMHPSAGAALVAAREPLVAFNVKLAPPASVEDARAIAARIREGGEQGLPGVRAIAVALSGGHAQVSTNVERPLELPLAAVLEAVARHAPVAGAELVGLAPSRALEGFPPDVALEGFDPARHLLENALRS